MNDNNHMNHHLNGENDNINEIEDDDEEMAPFALSIHQNILYNGPIESRIHGDQHRLYEKNDAPLEEPEGTNLPKETLNLSIDSHQSFHSQLSASISVASHSPMSLPSTSAVTPSIGNANGVSVNIDMDDSIIAAAAAEASMMQGQAALPSNSMLSYGQSTVFHSTHGLRFTQLMQKADETYNPILEHSDSTSESEHKSEEPSLHKDSHRFQQHLHSLNENIHLNQSYISQQSSVLSDINSDLHSSSNSSITPMVSNHPHQDNMGSQSQSRLPPMGLESSSESSFSSHSNNNSQNYYYNHTSSHVPPPSSFCHTMPSTSAKAVRTGEDSFRSAILIPQAMARSVIQIASNVELLRLWCEPVLAAFVTKESERTGSDRVYDAEWIEAATTLHPPAGGGYGMFTLYRTMKSYLGFPTHGKITLFIERKRGQMGFTIGPLGGFSEVSHTMTFEQYGNDVCVTDCVKVHREFIHHNDDSGEDEENFRRNNEHSNDEGKVADSSICQSYCCHKTVCCCSISCNTVLSSCCPTTLQRWFLPGLEHHMNQSIQSMNNLKQLIEHGECVAYDMSNDYSDSGGYSGYGSGGLMDDKGVTPLLGGHVL